MVTKAIARHYCVHGRVQGVFYRGSASAEAQRLGLVGWVRNLADGSVEAYACGDANAIECFEKWLRHGPRDAYVTNVTADEAALQVFADFEVR